MPPFNMNGANNANPNPGFTPGNGSNMPPQPPVQAAPMTFMESITVCFNKYTDFNGRASRAEFWWFMLFCFIVSGVCSAISSILGGIAELALLLPTLTVSWRRLHDTGRAGGWWFIGLIPLVGWIILIVWYVQRSQDVPNRFGPVPVK